MRKYLFIVFLFAALQSIAQTTTITTKIDQKTIVKDDSGMLLPYAVWQKMMQSGDFILKRPNPAVAEYIVYKMSAEEKSKDVARNKSYAVNMPKPRASDSFKEGVKFSGEKFKDMNGNKFDLRNADGKIYVLNFWFINCPPCKKEIPDLNELVAKYKDQKDVVFLAIALDGYADLSAFLKTTPFDYKVIDDGRYYSTKYAVKAFPTHVVVGKDGLIKFSTLGLAPNTVYWIEKTINEQLNGI